MLEPERVDRMLDRIAADVAHLRGLRDRGSALLDDRTALDSAKCTFVTAIEGRVRVAHHLVASEGWRVQESNADAVRRLGVERVLTPRLAASVVTAIGFRNVLAHQYADVDDARVLANLGLLEDLDEFVSQEASWLGDR